MFVYSEWIQARIEVIFLQFEKDLADVWDCGEFNCVKIIFYLGLFEVFQHYLQKNLIQMTLEFQL